MSTEPCVICGGDGNIHNSFGLTNRCPTCKGSGKRGDAEPLWHDVTKTKPSHHRQSNKGVVVVKKEWPDTYEAIRLATEVKACTSVTPDVKARMIREIIDYEGTHATCTQTFQRKIRKLIR
jgi:hypothetical protein